MDKRNLIDGKFRYYAFIAYTHYNDGADFRFANWLYEKLQMYRLPTKLVKIHKTPKRLKPIFLDFRCMKPKRYSKADKEALKESKYLIVLCSKNLVEHGETVDKEISDFLKFNKYKIDRIIPIITDGTKKEAVSKCFPSILAKMKDPIVAPNVSAPDGRKDRYNVLVKTISYMHGIETEELEILDRKRKRKNRILTSVLSFLLLIFLSFFYSWATAKTDIKNKIIEARSVSETNIHDAVEKLLEVEKRQKQFLLKNDKVYRELENTINYQSGQCLRKEQLVSNNIESIDVVNASGNLFGVKTRNLYYVIDMNDFLVKYEISTNDIWYEKDNRKYQMSLRNDQPESFEIGKVWCDNNKIYLTLDPKSNIEKKARELVIEINNDISYDADFIWDDRLYEKKDDGIQMKGTVLTVSDADGTLMPLVHESYVGAYSVRSDLNVIWSIDKNGNAYIWSIKNGYSIIDKMYDNNNNYMWGITIDGLLFKVDLNNRDLTPIIKNKEIAFIGQDDKNIFITIKNDEMKYPLICICDKNIGVVKQINRKPEIEKVNKHLMAKESNSFSPRECVIVAEYITDYIDGKNIANDIYDKNNAIKFVDVSGDITLADIKVYLNFKNSDGLNPMRTTVLSNHDKLTPVIESLGGMPQKLLYKIDEGEWQSLYTDSGVLIGISISKDMDYEKEHILHLKSIEENDLVTIKSFRFVMKNEDVEWRVGTQDKKFIFDEIAEIETPNILIECKENYYNPVKEIIYAFDNDPELYTVRSGRAEIKIPQKYLDGNEHKIVMYFVSENVTTRYYVYSFKYN